MNNQTENTAAIKVDHWSHGAGEWMHYGYFSSVDEIEKHIEEKGYDSKYFNYVMEQESPDA